MDQEADLREAFACFDDGDKGVVSTKELREWLGEGSDRLSPDEVGSLSLLILSVRAKY